MGMMTETNGANCEDDMMLLFVFLRIRGCDGGGGRDVDGRDVDSGRGTRIRKPCVHERFLHSLPKHLLVEAPELRGIAQKGEVLHAAALLLDVAYGVRDAVEVLRVFQKEGGIGLGGPGAGGERVGRVPYRAHDEVVDRESCALDLARSDKVVDLLVGVVRVLTDEALAFHAVLGAGGEERVGDMLVDAQRNQIGEVAALDRRCRGVVDHAEFANVEHGDMLVEQQRR